MLSRRSIKEEVYKYVRKHPKATEEEIAAVLKVDIIDVLNALFLLQDEGKVKSEEIPKSEIL